MTSERLGVLVLGVGGNVSQGIQKGLERSPRRWRIVAGCVSSTSVGLHLADRAYVGPRADDPEFVAWVIDVCRRERIVAVLSGVEEVLGALAPNAGPIREATGATVISAPPEVLAIAADKLKTAEWLEAQGLNAPATARADDVGAVAAVVDQCGWPVIVKPARGKGGYGVSVVEDQDALDRFLHDRSLVVQEHLGASNEEYTVGCVSDTHGRLAAAMPLRRELAHGTTVRAWAGSYPAVEAAAREIVTRLVPRGPCNVQMRLRGAEPVCFEINARFSGTTPTRVHMGFDEIDAVIANLALGEPMPTLRVPRSGIMLRYWNEAYVSPEAVASLVDGEQPPEQAIIEDWGT